LGPYRTDRKKHLHQKYKTKLKQLNLPEYSFRIIERDGEELILDLFRKKFVKLTPEEWVRQNFARYLIEEGKYPLGLMGLEMQHAHNRIKRRTDILVHDRYGKPVMIVECKSTSVELTEKVFGQITDYNRKFRVPYLVVTNGYHHYACRFSSDFSKWEYLLVIPLYEEIITENNND